MDPVPISGGNSTCPLRWLPQGTRDGPTGPFRTHRTQGNKANPGKTTTAFPGGQSTAPAMRQPQGLRLRKPLVGWH